MQGGGGEARDGVSVGLAEETHGAERVAAEERRGGAQGDQSHVFNSSVFQGNNSKAEGKIQGTVI